jgi:hypothetical protein
MILYHATTRANLTSIETDGLLVSHANPNGKIKGVWLHTRSNGAWAVLHTQKRHKVALEEVVIIELKVSRRKLKRFQTGLWYCTSDIAPASLIRTIDSSEYAASAK